MAEPLRIFAQNRAYWINDPGGRIGSKLVNGEPYERKLLQDVFRRSAAGRVAFDIGAHVGNHALYLAAVCGLTVYAFEPHPSSFAALEANVALNPELDIRTVHVAAGLGDAQARFVGAMQLVLDDDGDVPVRSLDDIVPPVDLAVVKVDVEGMEHVALGGMVNHLRRCRPVVYAETHTPAAHAATAVVLEPLGYHHTKSIRMGSVMEVWEG